MSRQKRELGPMEVQRYAMDRRVARMFEAQDGSWVKLVDHLRVVKAIQENQGDEIARCTQKPWAKKAQIEAYAEGVTTAIASASMQAGTPVALLDRVAKPLAVKEEEL